MPVNASGATTAAISLRAIITKILKNPNKSAHFAQKSTLVAPVKTYANKMCAADCTAAIRFILSMLSKLKCSLRGLSSVTVRNRQ